MPDLLRLIDMQTQALDRRLRSVKREELEAVQAEIRAYEKVKGWFLNAPLPQQSVDNTNT